MSELQTQYVIRAINNETGQAAILGHAETSTRFYEELFKAKRLLGAISHFEVDFGDGNVPDRKMQPDLHTFLFPDN